MKKKNIIKMVGAALAFSMSATSCADWLDVKMSDKIMENTLFSTNGGFQTALNGVYLGLLSVYGEDLSMGIIDIMAQYYNITPTHTYKIYADYEYGDDGFKTKSNTLWTNMYGLIANLNTLLSHCDEEGTALRSNYYPVIKGEALALRAMMHFDLLRLYGPSYSDATASVITIPYQNTATRDITPLLSAKEVIGLVIQDLEEAVRLLKEGDPVLTEGVRNGVTSDDGLDKADFTYRQFRLNYFAAQTLLARAYLWKGDKATAYRIAKEEIVDKNFAKESAIFPWITETQITAEKKNDRLFSTEVFFGLYNSSRQNINSRYFSSSLQKSSRLTFWGSSTATSRLQTFYDEPDNDWRSTYCWEQVEVTNPADLGISNDDENKDDGDDDDQENVTGASMVCFTKYADTEQGALLEATDSYIYMVPLIRLTEAYLIAAECADNSQEAIGYINEVRDHRHCTPRDVANTNQLEIQQWITEEFAREVIGEGQLFFHYKRLNKTEFPSGREVEGSVGVVMYNMVPSNYVWPLPEVEINKRGN